MIFASQIFLFYFLPVVLLVYYLLPRSMRNVFLTLASYVFYGWWHPWFVYLMLASTLVDYACGKVITAPGASEARRKLGVTASVVVNLSLLGFFKYYVFTAENLNRLLEPLGAGSLPILTIVLPAGISFYTFQSMSYSIDLYRGHARPARNLLDFSCYVALFPQLIAGPIVRYQDLAEQLRERPQRGEMLAEGACWFMIGFAKKVLLADTISQAAIIAFDEADALGPAGAWFGLFCFYFQLYFDFSGYSDMAIGLGRMFGFQMPINFRSPYRAESFTDFWQRWHLSLSTWLRDYLFIPLGGSRGTKFKVIRNILITFVIGGFWHGAQWRYVIWGFWHGLMLVLERVSGRGCLWWFLPKFLRVGVTVFIFQFNWLLFRCDDLSHGARYLRAMFFGVGDPEARAITDGMLFQPFHIVCLIGCAAVVWGGLETPRLVKAIASRPVLAALVFVNFLWSVLALWHQNESPFLYFQF